MGHIKLLIAILPFSQNFFEMVTLCFFLTSGFAPRGFLTLRVFTRYMTATDPSFFFTANVPSAPPAMASDLADKINRMTLARTKLEVELDINHEWILEAIERKNCTIEIQNCFQSCKDSLEKAVSKK